MTQTRVYDLIVDNLEAIYGYAYNKLYDKSKAEDLASEIVCEILASVKRLQKEEAFWGFAWRIAENTFRKFIKREELIRRAEETPLEDATGVYDTLPEVEYIRREQADERQYLLRRELSLLARTHREICVSYYIDNKSCSQIADEQHISTNMVKYYLFKTRKLLKEGIDMTRKLGEKSYNPGTFCLDFWGDRNLYDGMFKRKLPGSIVLAAYPAPMSAEELSIELGVAMPYLEDELTELEAAGVLVKVGNKYRTNIVIITDEYEKEFVRQTSPVYDDVAAKLWEMAVGYLPKIRSFDFQGNDYDDNRLLFAVINMALVNGFMVARERSPYNEPPTLSLGGHGWIFGYDHAYINYHYNGVTMKTQNKAQTAWFSAENYRVIASCQLYDHWRFDEKTEAMCDAIHGSAPNKDNDTLLQLIESGFVLSDGERLSANFPVFTSEIFEEICQVLAPLSELVANCMIDISGKAEKLLSRHAPAALRSQCGDIAKIHHRLDVAAFLMEKLIADQKLIVPAQKMPICVWGVKCTNNADGSGWYR